MISMQQRMACSREILAHDEKITLLRLMISIQNRMAIRREIAPN